MLHLRHHGVFVRIRHLESGENKGSRAWSWADCDASIPGATAGRSLIDAVVALIVEVMLGEGRDILAVHQRGHGAHARRGGHRRRRAAPVDRSAARSACFGSWQAAQDIFPEADSEGSKNNARPSVGQAAAVGASRRNWRRKASQRLRGRLPSSSRPQRRCRCQQRSGAPNAASVDRRLSEPAAAVAGHAGIEQLSHVHRVEYVGTIAEIAAYLDFAALRRAPSGFPPRPGPAACRRPVHANIGSENKPATASNRRTSSSLNRRCRISSSASVRSSSARQRSPISCTRRQASSIAAAFRGRRRPSPGAAPGSFCSSMPDAPCAVRVQPQTRRQLLGILEIDLQRLGQAFARDGHDPLIALRAVVGLQGHGQIAGADQVADSAVRAGRPRPGSARGLAHAQVRWCIAPASGAPVRRPAVAATALPRT